MCVRQGRERTRTSERLRFDLSLAVSAAKNLARLALVAACASNWPLSSSSRDSKKTGNGCMTSMGRGRTRGFSSLIRKTLNNITQLAFHFIRRVFFSRRGRSSCTESSGRRPSERASERADKTHRPTLVSLARRDALKQTCAPCVLLLVASRVLVVRIRALSRCRVASPPRQASPSVRSSRAQTRCACRARRPSAPA